MGRWQPFVCAIDDSPVHVPSIASAKQTFPRTATRLLHDDARLADPPLRPFEREVTRPKHRGHVVVPVAEEFMRQAHAAERLRASGGCGMVKG